MIGKKIDVNERPPLLQCIPLSLQHLFAMFGATVLVPFLVGLDPSVTLFTSGIGTLLFILITKGKIPSYLGSSFAFITGLTAIIGKVAPGAVGSDDKIALAMCGCVAVGVIYIIVSLLISTFGTKWIDVVFPSVVVGPVVMVIGLALAPTAVSMATANGLDNWMFVIPLGALLIAVLASIFFRGFLGVIPVLIGIAGGYLIALAFGKVDFSAMQNAKFIAVPHFILPKFNWAAIITMVPAAFVVITEHIGHLFVTNNVVGRDFFKDPGLHYSLAGDGVATAIAGMLGGPPSTTYGENIGVMAITRVYSVWVIGGAAVFAVILSFLPQVGGFIHTIPVPVMGGICILLFGLIASAGVRMLVEAGIDFSNKRNLIIASVILVIGVGLTQIKIFGAEIPGMAIATIAGILLNLIIPHGNDLDAAAEETQSEAAATK